MFGQYENARSLWKVPTIHRNLMCVCFSVHQLLPILCIACQNESGTVPLIPQTRDRRIYYYVRVLYFDRLLMKSFSGIATCHAAILPHDAPSTEESPEVICEKPFVIVKLPAKGIKSVKVLGEYLLMSYTTNFRL